MCPVNGMMPYLAMRGAQAGPLFITKDRKQLTWQLFSSNLKIILQKMKINASQYNTHSFCIGAATSAKEARIADAHIQMLERWKNQAYLQYIRTLRSQLAHYSNNSHSAATGLINIHVSNWTEYHAQISHTRLHLYIVFLFFFPISQQYC